MFNLHHLGWNGFQELCLTIARETFGQTVQSFLETADAGRDGAFTGTWSPTPKLTLSGRFVFQCKFSSKADRNIRLTDIKDELSKIRKLVKAKRCNVYLLMTNMGVSGEMEMKIVQEIRKRGVKECLVFGYTWIDQVIKENTRLRVLVPRVYGLGDLSQIMDERVYKQGQQLLEYLKNDMSKVVVTQAYRDAAKALSDHGFVLLIGDPAAGKTTIASLLAMGALDEWKARTMKLSRVQQVVHHWNPEDSNTFFWVDDAFGVTQHEASLTLEWNHHFLEISSMLKQGVKLVLTSRNYIYNSARKDLKASAFPLLNESQVVIDVKNLSMTERRQILYNHLKMGKQPMSFREQLKPHLETIVLIPSFNPETARRLSYPIFTKGLYLSDWHINRFVNQQEAFLVDLIKELDEHSRAALALIYMGSGRLQSPIDFASLPRLAIERLGSSVSKSINAMEAMNGNLVELLHLEGESYWRFRHPTIGDAFAIYIREAPELMEIFLHGTQTDKLMQQVTCGDMGIEKAVIIPKTFYAVMLEKLERFTATPKYKQEYLQTWGARRELMSFLATRCSTSFLNTYVEKKPTVVDEVSNPTSTREYSPDIKLAHRFFKEGFFSEDQRKTLVNRLISVVMKGEDMYLLVDIDTLELFTDQELEEVKQEVNSTLLDKLPSIWEREASKFEKRWRPSEDADDHMYSILNNFEQLRSLYDEGSTPYEKVDSEIQNIQQWVEANKGKVSPVPERQTLSGDQLLTGGDGNRSIFDDIND